MITWDDPVPLSVISLLADDTRELELPSGNGGVLVPMGEGLGMVPETSFEKLGETVAGTDKLPFVVGYGDSMTAVLVSTLVLVDMLVTPDIEAEISVKVDEGELMLRVREEEPLPVP